MCGITHEDNDIDYDNDDDDDDNSGDTADENEDSSESEDIDTKPALRKKPKDSSHATVESRTRKNSHPASKNPKSGNLLWTYSSYNGIKKRIYLTEKSFPTPISFEKYRCSFSSDHKKLAFAEVLKETLHSKLSLAQTSAALEFGTKNRERIYDALKRWISVCSIASLSPSQSSSSSSSLVPPSVDNETLELLSPSSGNYAPLLYLQPHCITMDTQRCVAARKRDLFTFCDVPLEEWTTREYCEFVSYWHEEIYPFNPLTIRSGHLAQNGGSVNCIIRFGALAFWWLHLAIPRLSNLYIITFLMPINRRDIFHTILMDCEDMRTIYYYTMRKVDFTIWPHRNEDKILSKAILINVLSRDKDAFKLLTSKFGIEQVELFSAHVKIFCLRSHRVYRLHKSSPSPVSDIRVLALLPMAISYVVTHVDKRSDDKFQDTVEYLVDKFCATFNRYLSSVRTNVANLAKFLINLKANPDPGAIPATLSNTGGLLARLAVDNKNTSSDNNNKKT